MKRRPSSSSPRARVALRGGFVGLTLAAAATSSPAGAQTRPRRPAPTPTQQPAPSSTQQPAPASTQQPAPQPRDAQTQAQTQTPPPPPPADAVPQMPPPPPAQMVSLREAVTLARRNPPQVLTAMAQLRVAEAQVALAQAPLIPTVTGTLGVTGSASIGSSVFGAQPLPNTGAFVSPFTRISLNWTIWDFGRTGANVAAAQASARASRASLGGVERLAVRTAATAFYALLLDEEVVEQDRQTVVQRQREFEIARGLVQAGARAPIEQTRAEVALDTARLDLTVAEAALRNDAAALAAALAIDPARELRVARPAEIVIDDDPARAANEAVSAIPEIQAARLQIEAAERQVAAARAGFLPSINFNATGSATYQNGPRLAVDPTTGATSWRSTEAESLGANATLQLSVPIYDPTVRANVRVSEAQVATARAALEQQVLAVRTEAVQAAIAVRSARQTLAQAERTAAGAAANLQQAEGRYAAGAAALLELVDAQAADAVARVNVARARFALESAKVRLITAVGRLNVLSGP